MPDKSIFLGQILFGSIGWATGELFQIPTVINY
jgi:hypothetical protein